MENAIQVQNDKIICQLFDVFQGKVDRDVIESVAYECEYNYDKSTNILLEMSGDSVEIIDEYPQTAETGAVVVNGEPPMKRDKSGQLVGYEAKLSAIVHTVKSGTKVLIILRGLPGSGKSHLGKEIVEKTIGACDYKHYVLSTDDFFCRNGRYEFNARFLEDAHAWNQRRALGLLRKGVSPVIIDNTNCLAWEMKPYMIWGAENAYVIEMLEPNTNWAFNEKMLSNRNRHGVPRNKIRDMLDRYDRSLTVNKLFSLFNIQYKFAKPPQRRTYPPVKEDDDTVYISEDDDELVPVVFANEDMPIDANKENDPKMVSSNDLYGSLQGWGISEAALRSWNVVRNLPADVPKMELTPVQRPLRKSVQMKDAETNTCSADFVMLHNGTGGQILIGHSRDICPKFCAPILPRSGLLDKGDMTDELGFETVDHKHLFALFEHIPHSYIKQIYEDSEKNINWTVEILLEENKEFLNGYVSPSTIEEPKEISVPTPMIVEDYSSDEEPPKKSPKASPGEMLAIKKRIEAGITINPIHYSKHILKLKHIDISTKPSTSRSPEEPPGAGEKVLIVDVEPRSPPVLEEEDEYEQLSDTEFEDYEDLCDEMIELNLGGNVVGQLEEYFGDTEIFFLGGYQPIVEIPKSLARQLHAFYLESVCRQMEAQKHVMAEMVKEDEEFAKQLQEQEATFVPIRFSATADTPDLKQIMSEQVEQSKREKANEQWKQMTPDDLAYRLTKQKLCTIFPDVEPDILYEILASHNNCYKDTVETILASDVRQSVDTFGTNMEPPISEHTVKDMKIAHAQTEEDKTSTVPLTSDSLRVEATKHQQKRQELMIKAQTYSRSGMPEVAWFYSNLASKQTHLCELYNNMAVEQVLNENFTKLQDFCTLDLHHLRVKEAMTALDIYLDRNIMLMREEEDKAYEFLMIITGRGKNSPGGIPKIRPKVKKRLNERSIGFEHLNPGLLKIRIARDSPLTDDLSFENS